MRLIPLLLFLKYEQPVGEHARYLVWTQERPIGCLAWSSAPRHLGSRDRYIGWSAEARRRNIGCIVKQAIQAIDDIAKLKKEKETAERDWERLDEAA